jgi:hypothetical protein
MSIMDRLVSYLESDYGEEPPSDTEIACAIGSILREPSEAMLNAGAKKARGGSPSDRAYAVWRAMVDEMLKD